MENSAREKTQLEKTLEAAEMRPSLTTEEMKSGPRPCHEEKSMREQKTIQLREAKMKNEEPKGTQV
jgi:hypothetical protein